MATEFKMPQLGLTMTEGTISKWLKNIGDTVAIGDLLVEVETDKITNQLESTIEGTVLEILVPEGAAAAVQSPIVIIGAPGEKVQPAAAAAAVVEVSVPAPEPPVPAMPAPLTDNSGLQASEFKMPQLGLTMTEGTITKWFKNVGDKVAIGDLLVEVETDKITNQLESTFEGTVLELRYPEGSAANVQATIAVIGEPGATVQSGAVAAVASPVTNTVVSAPVQPTAVPRAAGERVAASPLARKMAKEQCIDLTVVTGTGPEGRIVERDIIGYSERNKVRTSPLAAKTAAEYGVDMTAIKKDSRIMNDDVLAAITKPAVGQPATALVPAAASAAGVPIAGMRKVISERMSLSWSLAPHVNMTSEVDMTAVTELKNKLSAASGKKISFTEIIIKCVAHTLTEFKDVNSSLINGRVVVHESVNVGMAVALDNGLIVPVIKDANQKSIVRLREEIDGLSQKARQGALLPDEIKGGTFTVTNLGMFGIDHFTPIINQPESAILGVCRIVQKPVVFEGAVVIRPMMNLCLSIDHRLIDGAVGARFLARLRQLLEQPLLLI